MINKIEAQIIADKRNRERKEYLWRFKFPDTELQNQLKVIDKQINEAAAFGDYFIVLNKNDFVNIQDILIVLKAAGFAVLKRTNDYKILWRSPLKDKDLNDGDLI